MDKDINLPETAGIHLEVGELELLSIVIPCYNDLIHINTAVNSAINQTWPNKEILIVDDGSSSQTKKLLSGFASEKISIITQSNQGPSAARNRGVEKAKGKFILVLDSDDYFEPEFSKKAIGVLKSSPEIKLVTCYGRWFSEKSSVIHKPAGGTIDHFLYECGAFGSAMFWKQDWEKAGGYDEAMRLGYEDWEFYIRLLEGGGETWVIPEILFHYRKKKTSRNSVANASKYEIWKYIFMKHAGKYIGDFERFVTRITGLLQQQENEKKQLRSKLEYRLGHYLLFPARKIRHYLSSR